MEKMMQNTTNIWTITLWTKCGHNTDNTDQIQTACGLNMDTLQTKYKQHKTKYKHNTDKIQTTYGQHGTTYKQHTRHDTNKIRTKCKHTVTRATYGQHTMQ